jgi:hypothetical protein
MSVLKKQNINLFLVFLSLLCFLLTIYFTIAKISSQNKKDQKAVGALSEYHDAGNVSMNKDKWISTAISKNNISDNDLLAILSDMKKQIGKEERQLLYIPMPLEHIKNEDLTNQQKQYLKENLEYIVNNAKTNAGIRVGLYFICKFKTSGYESLLQGFEKNHVNPEVRIMAKEWLNDIAKRKINNK